MKMFKNFDKKKSMILIGCIVVILAVIIGIIMIIVNDNKKNSIKGLANEYMSLYQKLDDKVVTNIKYEFDDKLTKAQKQKYRGIMENQYEELEYEILEVQDDGITGTATVRFTVYDLASAIDKANSYINVYGSKFEKEGKFDSYAAIDYKLEQLDNVELRIDYTITLDFYKDKDKWVMKELSEADLKKINGTY